MTDALRVVIYAAKSTTDTKGSIPDQIEACGEYAKRQGWIVDGKPESDEAASAYTGNRGEGLARAMERAEALAEADGQAGILVWHSNRIARGGGDRPDAAKHLAEYVFWALRSNIELHSVNDDATFATPFMAAVIGHMTHQESKIKSENVRAGMKRRRARKLHTGGDIYGYDRDKDVGLRANAQADTVRRIFNLVASGTSQAQVARALNAEGVKPLRADTWVQGSISKLLKSRTYLGEIPDGEGDWTEGAHKAIVSQEAWDAANARSGEAASVRGRKGGNRPKAGHLIPGRMLRHATCGNAMARPSNEVKKDGTVTGSYVCSGEKNGTCEGFRVNMADVDETLIAYLAEVGIDVEKSLRLIEEATETTKQSTARELEAAKRDAAKASENYKRVKRDYTEGGLPLEQWLELGPELEEARKASDARVAQLEAKAAAEAADPEVVVPLIADALALVRAAMTSGDTQVVRTAIESLFSEFLIGELGELPEEAVPNITPDAGRRTALREAVAAMEERAGRTVAEANAEAMEEIAELEPEWPEPPESDEGHLIASEGVAILPVPREDALRSIVADGEPVYLTDKHGNTIFNRLPLRLTNYEGLPT